MLVATGSFTGNATNRSITGVGFQPDLVILKNINRAIASNSDATGDTWWRTSLMPSNSSLPVRIDFTGYSTNHVKDFEADGFAVGTDNGVNASGNTICWVACKNDARNDLGLFTYTGDATDDKLVFSEWQPEFTMLRGSSFLALTKFSGMASALANQASNFANATYANGPTQPDCIGFFSDGLRVSNGSAPVFDIANRNGETHHGFAFRSSGGNFFATGSYTGTGVARTITTGIAPAWIYVRSGGNADSVIIFQSQFASGNTQPFFGSQATGKISNITSTGFDVSTDTNVNANGVIYYWAVLANNLVLPSGFLSLF